MNLAMQHEVRHQTQEVQVTENHKITTMNQNCNVIKYLIISCLMKQ